MTKLKRVDRQETWKFCSTEEGLQTSEKYLERRQSFVKCL